MAPDNLSDDQDLRLTIQRLARRIRSMQADDDVTEGQRAVLFALSKNGTQTLGSLSEHERVTPPSMNRTVNALVQLDLVTREPAPDDARKVSIDLSASGRAFISETRRRRDAWFTTRLDALPSDQRQMLREVAPILRDLADR
ncbi:MarR family winged helix-turn-helix transcriptional regulator [Frigoribacterium sp. CG_9.8]|uniref:MarR family winged helix-turn-helix transcriptional regulator n=1 Tax=Frigoribacterium sp. CG_9.8 TaxID=2787733 RepID=UPI0018CBBE6B|nr:MarR family transcriptional regulator [Frigoribacterium sp. CG_9.8]MBG6108769.1 DNA-binding MarR family transcriptional regulator [Frigoribacterium sp. CG_9.8]